MMEQLEVVVFWIGPNEFEWRLLNDEGETVDSGRASTVAQARLDGHKAIKGK